MANRARHRGFLARHSTIAKVSDGAVGVGTVYRSKARDLDATAVGPGGTTTTEPLPAKPNPPVDCFYVYPTVDLLSNPVLKIGSNPPVRRDIETSVLLAQVTYPGQVAGQCRSVIGPKGRLTWLQVTGLEKIKVSRAAGGLHTIDANVTSGDLVALLAAQSRAWTATH